MVTLVIPTYNESQNILKAVQAADDAFSKARVDGYEILVMDDDSPDGTSDKVNQAGLHHARAINRRGKARGLSLAVVDGFSEAKNNIVGVMDADLSHPASALPEMLKALNAGALMAIGSRYVPGGGVANWPWPRRWISRFAALLARPFTKVKDNGSGFFLVQKSVLKGVALNPTGFKIGLEILIKGRHEGKITEVPIIFTDRKEGTSKFGMKVTVCYLQQLLSFIFYKPHQS